MTTTPDTIEFVPFTARLQEDLHTALRDRADELDWSMNSALNEAVKVFLERSAERDTAAWMANGWEIMAESGCSGHGYHIDLFVSLPNVDAADQIAYDLQELVSRTASEFGGREVATRIMAVAGMEMRH